MTSGQVMGEGRRVLLAEDNLVNQKLARILLQKMGFKVVVAENGASALSMVAAQLDAFALVIMDCQMPEMNGYDAARAIRDLQTARGTKRRLPIVAMTANAMSGDEELCLSSGMDFYVAKPIDPQKLTKALNAALSL